MSAKPFPFLQRWVTFLKAKVRLGARQSDSRQQQQLDTASDLFNQAHLYASQGKYAEAESLYQHALSIYEQQLGETHSDTAISLNNLAALYEDQGRYGEAEPLYQRALTIKGQQLGPQHPDTLATRGNYTALLRAMGRDREAARLQAEQPPSS